MDGLDDKFSSNLTAKNLATVIKLKSTKKEGNFALTCEINLRFEPKTNMHIAQVG